MACSCADKSAPNGWIITKGDGTSETRSTKIEAAALAARTGGSYRRA